MQVQGIWETADMGPSRLLLQRISKQMGSSSRHRREDANCLSAACAGSMDLVSWPFSRSIAPHMEEQLRNRVRQAVAHLSCTSMLHQDE